MNGKLIGGFIVVSALLTGLAIYYLQVYGYYEAVPATGRGDVKLVSLATGEAEPIVYENFKAIDASSSPIRYRACFTTPASQAMLTETYQLVEDAVPRIGPRWFDCFDAGEIAEALEAGTALAFLGEKNVQYGVDRIVVITEDGRGFVWNDLNHCGEKAYDGTVVGEECPPKPKGG